MQLGTAEALDLELLCRLGRRLDSRPMRLAGRTVRELLMEELLRIRTRQGQLLPLRLNPAQRELEHRSAQGAGCGLPPQRSSFGSTGDSGLAGKPGCGRKYIVLKARQLGITTYVAARFLVHTITRPGTLSVQVAHDQTAAEAIFRIVHRFVEHLPERLRAGALCTSRANVRQIVFPRLDSEYRVETAADPNAGRGMTIQNLHCSEVARWPGETAETLAGLRAAVPPHGEIVLESTPNGTAGAFYEEWHRAQETGYARHFFPWWWEREYRRPADELALSADEAALVQRFGLSCEQIAFRREMRANFGTRFDEEFTEDPVTCFLASGECVFELPAVEQRLREVAGPAESAHNGCLQVWLPQVAGRRYLIGVDPGEGNADGDYSCAQVLDRETALQCAELHGHFDPRELAARVTALARRYNDALVAVKRNNHGHAVIAQMLTVHAYPNLFPDGGKPGWLTTRVNRPPMLEELAAVLSRSPRLFNSRRLLEQCRTFVRRQDGRAEAEPGSHDDAVMAMAIALAARNTI
ncbi:MAG: terminase [Candidatus Korobacteraceae bacterium]|jgi:hypothetical protein